MKRFILKLTIFAIPFILYALFIFIIDPYNYFNVSKVIPDEIKKNTSYRMNYAMWKIIGFKHEPSEYILLGDSRMGNINTDSVNALTGHTFSNMAYGGGSIIEMIKTFWFADSICRIKEVYFGINFNLYNLYDTKDRVSEAIAISNNPAMYIVSINTVNAAFQNIKAALSEKEIVIGKPEMDKGDFWQFQLNNTAKMYYTRYAHPDSVYSELRKISEYCKENDIRLFFVMMPEHADLFNKIEEYGLEEDFNRFNDEISSIGTVIDMSTESSIVNDRSNFRDPYHPTHKASYQLIHSIWDSH